MSLRLYLPLITLFQALILGKPLELSGIPEVCLLLFPFFRYRLSKIFQQSDDFGRYVRIYLLRRYVRESRRHGSAVSFPEHIYS